MSVITPVGVNGVPIPAIQLGASQDRTYAASGGASAQSSAFGATTTLIQVSVHLGATASGVRIAIAANPTAVATGTLLPASGTWFFAVQPTWKIAALSDDANTGTINITEAVDLG